MQRFWFGLWLALTILVGGVAPVPGLVPADPGAARVGQADLPIRQVLLGAPGALDLSKAGHPGRRPLSSLQKGPTAGGDGAPPGARPDCLAAFLPPLPAAPRPRAAAFPPSQPRTFAPHGMQPEQGGQTGPPRDLVIA